VAYGRGLGKALGGVSIVVGNAFAEGFELEVSPKSLRIPGRRLRELLRES